MGKIELNETLIFYIGTLKNEGIIIIETDEPERDIKQINDININYKMYDLRKYGRASLIFLK